MIRNKFSEAFKVEHNLIYDDLLNLKSALKDSDFTRSVNLIKHLNEITELHFKVEREVLYPMLTNYTDEDYIAELTEGHSFSTRILAELGTNISDTGSFTGIDTYILKDLNEIIRNLMNCDGLTLVIDRLPDHEIKILNREISRIWESPLLSMNIN